MWFGLIILGISIVISVIAVGSEESSQLYYDLVEDAGDFQRGKKATVTVDEEATKPQPKKVEKKPDDVDTLAQEIYDSVEM